MVYMTSIGQCVTTQAYLGTNSVSNQNYTGRLGLSFTTTANLMVDSLGAYDAGLDGLVAGTIIEVGIVKVSDGSLVGSTITFTNNEGVLNNMFRMKPLVSPILLEMDTAYILVAVGFNANDGNHNAILAGGSVVGTDDGGGLLIFGNYYYDANTTFGGTFSNNFASPPGAFHSATMAFAEEVVNPIITGPISISPNFMISCEDDLDPYSLELATGRGLPQLVTDCVDTITLADLLANSDVIDGFEEGEMITINNLTLSYTQDTIVHPLGRCDAFGRKFLVRRTYTATDDSGNMTTVQHNITITDKIAPTLVTNTVELYLDASCEVTFSADTLVDAATDDNCSAFDAKFPPVVNPDSTGMMRVLDSGLDSVKILTLTKADFNFTTCPAIVSIELFITDECGNVAIDTVSVAIRDIINPTITACVDDSSYEGCDEGDIGPPDLAFSDTEVIITEADFTTTLGGDVSDVCGIMTVAYIDSLDESILDCTGTNPVVRVIRTYTVTDSCGNTDNCVQIIEINDTTNPTFGCPIDMTVNTSDDGVGNCGTVVNGLALLNLLDNCSDPADLLVNYTISGTTMANGKDDASGNDFNLGLNTVEYFVMDCSGNIDSCDFTITVLDDEAPEIDCSMSFSMNNDPDRCSSVVCYAVEADDNCTPVQPTTLPGFTYLGTFGGSTYFRSIGIGGFESWENANTIASQLGGHLVSINSQGEQDFLFNTAPTGRYWLGLRFAPSVGMSGEFKWTSGEDITFENWGPGQPGNSLLHGDYVLEFDTNGGLFDGWYNGQSFPPARYIIEFEGPRLELIDGLASGSSFPVGITPVTYRVVDAAGNADTCMLEIVVLDIQDPVITCPTVPVAQLEAFQCDTVLMYDTPTATDNCDAIVTQIDATGLSSDSAFLIGITELIYEARDTSGNADTCSIFIEVLEFQVAEMQCENINLSLDQVCEGSVTLVMAIGATEIGCPDSCKIVIKDKLGNEYPNLFNATQINKEFEYTIYCGGNSCWANVIIKDDLKPTISNCVNDTINCVDNPSIAIKPTADDNCIANLVKLDSAYTNVGFECDSFLLGEYTFIWQAVDAAGNVSEKTCTQKVGVSRTDFSSIPAPKSFTGVNFLECNSFPALTNGAPTPKFATVPKLGGVDLFPFNQATICNGFVKFEDEIILDTKCKKMIQRIWTIGEWHCDSIARKTLVQVFEIKDTKGPVFVTKFKDITISAERFCEGKINLPDVTLTDACNGVKELYVSTGSGVFTYTSVGNGLFTNSNKVTLKEGKHTLIFFAKDECGKPSTDSMKVTVQDLLPPIALCETFTTVSLTSDGQAWVKATSIDDGSFDDCSPSVSFEIARVFNSPLDTMCNPDHLNWTDEVAFCCSDVGRIPFPMVALKVSDNGGNTSICMVQVEVQNKEQFNQVICPSNLTVKCDLFYDPTNLTTAFGAVDLPGLICPGNVILDDRITNEALDACRVGTIYRTIDVKFGGKIVYTCQQTITVQTDNPIDGNTIIWPKNAVITNVCPDVAADPNFMAADIARPIVTEGSCNLVGMEKSDKVFQIAGNGACYKIVRTWSVIDWCGRNQNNADTIPTWSREQVIEIRNTIAPVITSADTTVRVFSYTPNCTPIPIKLTASATDSCTLAAELQWDWTITLEGGSKITGKGNDASGTYPIGNHSIEFIVRDRCGNVTKTGYTFEVINAKTPTPYCKYGLSTSLVPMDMDPMTPGPDVKMAVVTPEYFDNGSYHVCGGDVLLSFSSDLDSTELMLTCDNVGKQNVELWVTDPITGNQAFCKTFIIVKDTVVTNSNGDTILICPSSLINIAGRVATSDNKGILASEVLLINNEVKLEHTDTDGQYTFANMPKGGDYMLEPHKDGDDMNGVSTLDLVLIQRHILGMAKFIDPYTLIAADINHDDKVTASDLVGLRKLILGVTDGFEQNTSWRFVDKDHYFPVATDPWAEFVKEDYEISYLDESMNVDFIGIKVGDVNGSVVTNVRDNHTENRSGKQLELSIENRYVTVGETVSVIVSTNSSVDLKGLQAAFQLKGLNLNSIKSASIEIDESNTYYNTSNILNISYANTNREVIPSATNLFTLVLTATKAGELKDMITINSDRMTAEAYTNESMDIEEVVIDWRDNKPTGDIFSVAQNEPNPWMNTTSIELNIPANGLVRINVKDVSGRVLYTSKKTMSKGNHTLILNKSDVSQQGVLIYEIEYDGQVISKKMISVN